MKHKLNTSFSALTDPVMLIKGRSILKGLELIWEGIELPSFVPNLTRLREGFEKYQNAYDAAINRDTVKIADRNEARKEFTELLERVAQYLEASAGENENMLRTSGFDLRKASGTTRAQRSIPATPRNFTVKRGGNRGQYVGSVAKQSDATCFEMHRTYGDPAVEANWQFSGVHVRPGEMVIENHEPGRQCAYRLRAHNAEGHGPWTPPVTIIPD